MKKTAAAIDGRLDPSGCSQSCGIPGLSAALIPHVGAGIVVLRGRRRTTNFGSSGSIAMRINWMPPMRKSEPGRHREQIRNATH